MLGRQHAPWTRHLRDRDFDDRRQSFLVAHELSAHGAALAPTTLRPWASSSAHLLFLPLAFSSSRVSRAALPAAGYLKQYRRNLCQESLLHISPACDEALNHLSYAVGASIALGVLLWGVTLYRMWVGQSAGQPGYSYQRPFFIIALITACLHHLPYILLLFRLQHKPDRAALAFSIGIPAASLVHTATTLPLIWRVFSYWSNVTQTLLPMCAAFILQVVILVLAWRANQRLGYKQEPVSLVIAGAAMYAYFIVFGSSNAWMYRFFH